MRDENLKPWDRQEGEGAKAYEAFCIYKDLGKGRSLPKVSQKLAKSLTIIKKWSFTHNWKTRADAWDRSITEEARQKAIKAQAEILNDSLKIGQMVYKRLANAFQNKDLEKTSTRSLVDGIEKSIMMSLNATKEIIGEEKNESENDNITFTFSRGRGNV